MGMIQQHLPHAPQPVWAAPFQVAALRCGLHLHKLVLLDYKFILSLSQTLQGPMAAMRHDLTLLFFQMQEFA